MKMRAFYNDKPHAVHIGGKTIMPGNTREIDETQHPDYKPAPVAQAEPVDPIAALLALSAKKLLPQLDALNNEQLAELDTRELNSSKPRTTITEAIAKIQLQRAQDDSDVERFAAQLETHNDAMLAELAELHAEDAHLLSLINEEQARRAQPE